MAQSSQMAAAQNADPGRLGLKIFRGGLFGALFVIGKTASHHGSFGAYFGLAIKLAQMLTFALADETEFQYVKSSVYGLKIFLGLTTINGYADWFSGPSFLVLFYFSLLWVVLLVSLSIWAVVSFARGTFSVLWPLRLLRAVGSTSTNILYIPMLTMLLSGFRCENDDTLYHGGSHPDSWWVQDDYPCTSPGWYVQATITGIAVTLFVALCAMWAAVIQDRHPLSVNLSAKAHGRLDLFFIVAKTVLVFLIKGWPAAMPPYAHIGVLLVVALAWLGGSILVQPYYAHGMNRANASAAAIFLSCIISIAVGQSYPKIDAAIAWYMALPFAALAGAALCDMKAQAVAACPLSSLSSATDVQLKARFVLHEALFGHPTAVLPVTERRIAKVVTGALDGTAETSAATNAVVTAAKAVPGHYGKPSHPASHEATQQSSAAGIAIVEDLQALSQEDDTDARGAIVRRILTTLQEARVGQDPLTEAAEVYSAGLSSFRHSPMLHIAASTFYATYTSNKHLQMSHLLQAERKSPGLDLCYIIFATRWSVEERGPANSRGQAAQSALARVAFEKYMADAKAAVTNVLVAQSRFWAEMASARPDVSRLHRLSTSMQSAQDIASHCFTELHKINGHSLGVVRLQAEFTLYALNDPERAAMLVAEVERMEETAAKELKASQGSNLKFLEPSQLDVMSDAAGVVIISAAAGSLGTILSASTAACRMFGYPRWQLERRSVDVLVPQPITEWHTAGLKRFLASGHGRVVDNTRMVLGQHKAGFIFPLLLTVRESSANDGPPQFIGLMQPLPTDEDFLIMDEKFTICAATHRGMMELGLNATSLAARERTLHQYAPDLDALLPTLQAHPGTMIQLQFPKELKSEGSSEETDNDGTVAAWQPIRVPRHNSQRGTSRLYSVESSRVGQPTLRPGGSLWVRATLTEHSSLSGHPFLSLSWTPANNHGAAAAGRSRLQSVASAPLMHVAVTADKPARVPSVKADGTTAQQPQQGLPTSGRPVPVSVPAPVHSARRTGPPSMATAMGCPFLASQPAKDQQGKAGRDVAGRPEQQAKCPITGVESRDNSGHTGRAASEDKQDKQPGASSLIPPALTITTTVSAAVSVAPTPVNESTAEAGRRPSVPLLPLSSGSVVGPATRSFGTSAGISTSEGESGTRQQGLNNDIGTDATGASQDIAMTVQKQAPTAGLISPGGGAVRPLPLSLPIGVHRSRSQDVGRPPHSARPRLSSADGSEVAPSARSGQGRPSGPAGRPMPQSSSGLAARLGQIKANAAASLSPMSQQNSYRSPLSKASSKHSRSMRGTSPGVVNSTMTSPLTSPLASPLGAKLSAAELVGLGTGKGTGKGTGVAVADNRLAGDSLAGGSIMDVQVSWETLEEEQASARPWTHSRQVDSRVHDQAAHHHKASSSFRLASPEMVDNPMLRGHTASPGPVPGTVDRSLKQRRHSEVRFHAKEEKEDGGQVVSPFLASNYGSGVMDGPGGGGDRGSYASSKTSAANRRMISRLRRVLEEKGQPIMSQLRLLRVVALAVSAIALGVAIGLNIYTSKGLQSMKHAAEATFLAARLSRNVLHGNELISTVAYTNLGLSLNATTAFNQEQLQIALVQMKESVEQEKQLFSAAFDVGPAFADLFTTADVPFVRTNVDGLTGHTTKYTVMTSLHEALGEFLLGSIRLASQPVDQVTIDQPDFGMVAANGFLTSDFKIRLNQSASDAVQFMTDEADSLAAYMTMVFTATLGVLAGACLIIMLPAVLSLDNARDTLLKEFITLPPIILNTMRAQSERRLQAFQAGDEDEEEDDDGEDGVSGQESIDMEDGPMYRRPDATGPAADEDGAAVLPLDDEGEYDWGIVSQHGRALIKDQKEQRARADKERDEAAKGDTKKSSVCCACCTHARRPLGELGKKLSFRSKHGLNGRDGKSKRRANVAWNSQSAGRAERKGPWSVLSHLVLFVAPLVFLIIVLSGNMLTTVHAIQMGIRSAHIAVASQQRAALVRSAYLGVRRALRTAGPGTDFQDEINATLTAARGVQYWSRVLLVLPVLDDGTVDDAPSYDIATGAQGEGLGVGVDSLYDDERAVMHAVVEGQGLCDALVGRGLTQGRFASVEQCQAWPGGARSAISGLARVEDDCMKALYTLMDRRARATVVNVTHGYAVVPSTGEIVPYSAADEFSGPELRLIDTAAEGILAPAYEIQTGILETATLRSFSDVATLQMALIGSCLALYVVLVYGVYGLLVPRINAAILKQRALLLLIPVHVLDHPTGSGLKGIVMTALASCGLALGKTGKGTSSQGSVTSA